MQATHPDQPWSKRHRMTTGLIGPWLLGCGVVLGCTASADEVRPPPDALFFPSGMVVSPDERVLFVANANSELRYDSGSISVIRLDAVQSTIAGWLQPAPVIPDGCERDVEHRETLVCNASKFIDGPASVRIGNFATDIAIQDFTAGGPEPRLRVVVPTRGDPSIAWADFTGDRLVCTGDGTDFALCDDEHRLTTVRNGADLPSIPNEPFGVFADSASGFAMVTHLSAGAVTLIDSPSDGPAQVVDIKGGLFASNAFGESAATGIAGRSPGSPDNIIYVGSRTDHRIQTFTVGRLAPDSPNPQDPSNQNRRAAYLLRGNFFLLEAVGENAGDSGDTRSLHFSPSGNLLYIVNRSPPSVQIYDTSLGPTGLPRNVAVGASDICRQGSAMTAFDAGDGERAYITCFQDGQIYVVDPRGQSQVEDVITVGRGPYGVVAARNGKQLFVSNFLEDTIAVVDVNPSSPTRNRVVLRIGRPRSL